LRSAAAQSLVASIRGLEDKTVEKTCIVSMRTLLKILKISARGQCYNHYFALFANVRKNNGEFLENKCCEHFLHKLTVFGVKNAMKIIS
jgi:hypothetical protein